MTTPHSVRAEIERLQDTLLKTDLVLDLNKALIVTHGKLTQVTWSRDPIISDYFNKAAGIEEYLDHLQKRNFSLVLFDGGLLQISFTFSGHKLQKHRLCFYPCPVEISPEDLNDFALDELVELFSEDMSRLRLHSPVRFDYDSESASEGHPASHLHLGHEHCRIPVYSPLSVGHFVRFVFMNFYHDRWDDSSVLQEWACHDWGRSITEAQRERLHINWVVTERQMPQG